MSRQRGKYKVHFWRDIFSDYSRRKKFRNMKRIHCEIEAMYPFLLDPDPVVRLGAVGYASQLNGGLDAVSNLRYDTDWRVKHKVVSILAHRGDPLFLVDILWDKDIKLQQRAIYGIGNRGDRLLRSLLLLKLISPNERVRKSAWYWIRREKEERATTRSNDW